jgi:hypothetical protein
MNLTRLIIQDLIQCGALERIAPCSEIASIPNSLRVHWKWPASRGYATTYIPPNAYQLEYYRVEISTTKEFNVVLRNKTCTSGQVDPTCNFDERIAIMYGLEKTEHYFVRVRAGTIIGDGANSSIIQTSIAGVPGPPRVNSFNSL